MAVLKVNTKINRILPTGVILIALYKNHNAAAERSMETLDGTDYQVPIGKTFTVVAVYGLTLQGTASVNSSSVYQSDGVDASTNPILKTRAFFYTAEPLETPTPDFTVAAQKYLNVSFPDAISRGVWVIGYES